MKGKPVETKFEKPSIIRQWNAFKSQRQSVLGKPATFSDSLAKKDFSESKSNTNVITPEMYKVHTQTSQTRTPQLPQDIRKTNKCVSFSTRVIPTTSVSKPPLKSNRMEDRVMPNNSQGKKQEPIGVPISTREPKRTVNRSVATSHKKTVATESTVEKPRSIIRKLYEHFSMTCSWWYLKFTPSGYKWKPMSPIGNVNTNVSMPLGNASRTANILEPMAPRCSTMSNTLLSSNSFAARTMKFGNGQIAPILGYGDLVQGNITIKRVYYVEGLNQSLFSVGQLRDADLEVAFRKSTCYVRDLKGNDLLTDSLLEVQTKVLIDFLRLVQRGLHAQVRTVQTDKGTKFLNKTLHAYFAKEAISTACFTQNRSLVIPLHEKIPYHIINGQKPSVKFFYIFGSLCYIVRDGENLDKMKGKGDACIFVGYSTQSRGYRVYNKRTRVIVETMHVNFDELPQMASDHVSSDPVPQCPMTTLEHESLSPETQTQENVTQAVETVTTSNELDLLFSLMFDELLNGTTSVVSKSSAVNVAESLDKPQQHNTTQSSTTTVDADAPPLNIQTTSDTTKQVPTVIATKNINQAETNKEYAQVEEDEFINIFSTPVQERGETSSRHVDSSNMHIFYQRHPPEHRWTKYHPLEQVIGNPS
ncbi:reverse transcriptase domain-containing protein [Tanacetum coccineum]